MIGPVEWLARMIDAAFPVIGGRERQMGLEFRKKIEAFRVANEADATQKKFESDTRKANAERLKKHDDDAAAARLALTEELDSALKSATDKSAESGRAKTVAHDEVAVANGKAGRRILALPDGNFEEYIPSGGNFVVVTIPSVDFEDDQPKAEPDPGPVATDPATDESPASADGPSSTPPDSGSTPEPEATPADNSSDVARNEFRPL